MVENIYNTRSIKLQHNLDRIKQTSLFDYQYKTATTPLKKGALQYDGLSAFDS